MKRMNCNKREFHFYCARILSGPLVHFKSITTRISNPSNSNIYSIIGHLSRLWPGCLQALHLGVLRGLVTNCFRPCCPYSVVNVADLAVIDSVKATR